MIVCVYMSQILSTKNSIVLSVLILSQLYLHVVVADRFCSWQPPLVEWDSSRCVPLATKQCELYESVKHRVINDEYTVNYFEKYLCRRTCLTVSTRRECEELRDNNCNWIGSDNGLGHCSGVTYTFEADLIDQNNFLKRQALYSYTIKYVDI